MESQKESFGQANHEEQNDKTYNEQVFFIKISRSLQGFVCELIVKHALQKLVTFNKMLKCVHK